MIVRVVDLNVAEPIDFVTPIQNLGGQKQLHITMLKRLEVMTLNQCMNQVAEGVTQ